MTVTEDTLITDFPVKPAWTKTASWWIGLWVTVVLGLVPIYKFASGGFQIVDPFIVVLIITAFFITDVNEHIMRHVYFLIPYIAWTIFVNGGYYIVYGRDISLKLLITSLYNFFILWSFTIVFYELLKKKGIIFIYVGQIFALISIFTVSGYKEWEGVRFIGSFNNPNALALFCLLLYCTVLLLMQYRIEHDIKNKIYHFFDVVIIITIQYSLWMSISRAGLAASLILNIALIRKIFSRRLFVPASLAISLMTVFVLFYSPTFLQEKLEARDPSRYTKEAVESRIRTSIIKPLEGLTALKILVGTGSVFVQEKTYPMVLGLVEERRVEIHNMLGHALWVYGIIGLLLYLPWLAKTIWETRILKDGFFIWGTILAFSLWGVVIRFRSFWIFLGLMLALVGLKLFEQEKTTNSMTADGLRG